jgi:hypothetical protein
MHADVGAPQKEVTVDEHLNDAGIVTALAPYEVIEDMLLSEDGFCVMLRPDKLECGYTVVEVVVEGLPVNPTTHCSNSAT